MACNKSQYLSTMWPILTSGPKFLPTGGEHNEMPMESILIKIIILFLSNNSKFFFHHEMFSINLNCIWRGKRFVHGKARKFEETLASTLTKWLFRWTQFFVQNSAWKFRLFNFSLEKMIAFKIIMNDCFWIYVKYPFEDCLVVNRHYRWGISRGFHLSFCHNNFDNWENELLSGYLRILDMKVIVTLKGSIE